MFSNLTNKFISIVKDISGYGRITEQKIQDTLKKIRYTLLSADVSLLTIDEIINKIKLSLVGKDINNSLTPGQEFIKILKKELIRIMGDTEDKIQFSKKTPTIFLITGLQGSGKTTTVGKLGYWITQKCKKTVLVASTDVYRPAAMHQLNTISKIAKIDFFQPKNIDDPIKLSKKAVIEAHRKPYDVLILDTAGRLHNNSKMMQQLHKIEKSIQPSEIFFIIDAMMGQDTINIAKKFNQSINISGLILTKVDSDARGGSALSASYIIKKPIKFIGTGEKIQLFSTFDPERIVNRILGMGDILSIIENIDKKHYEKNQKNLVKNSHIFDLNDFKSQIETIEKIGGIESIVSKLPMNNFNLKNMKNNKSLSIITTIINSMTPYERKNPEIIKNSRKKRIANGSGTNIQDINKLLKQFYALKKMMKKLKHSNTKNMFQNFKYMIPSLF